ncbi:HAMP domain-containing histidine kinase [Micromonospora sp. DR5-3]|uniref:sensor histidine kinase n=1 Tax=unclassified Micromonospora TaxID=2617518 RepID=UPI0011D6D81B|nr:MULTISPECIES: HAMP domain-containing sensor histidine kinase [unclassified Micromonospora]MCW3818094.1 HAMP domain-containing histidine kinase [Micromonospora sp. DR5-3]TYC22299.1 HAMP domain-containing protein [Micromonospora sp. MP36]
MSSSRRSDLAGRLRRWFAGWSLRRRLVLSVVALLALVSVGIGGLTTVALRHFLVGQVDDQLTMNDRRSGDLPPWFRQSGDSRRPGPGAQRPEPPPGFPSGSIAMRITDGVPIANARAESGGVEPLSATDVAALVALPTDAQPRTVELGDRGDYRAAAHRMANGDVQAVAIPLAEVEETVMWMAIAQAGVIGAGLIIAGGLGALIVRATLRPLNRVAATATRVTELPLDRGEVALSVRVPAADTDPRTEVGQVGGALNRMLGHVAAALAARQASETRVRQFVADASHELRTPLAAIRGYAEVARRGRDEVPPDVAHALRRVESESTRMTSLVDDLLLLARLDSGRPLAAEPVDLTALVVNAVSDAHVAGPDHRWQLDLPDEPVTVTGDAHRLHQVVANLLANARVHTPPGSTVTVRLTAVADGVELSVTDDGPGIPADLQPEVFERFARGDSSRSRAHGSTGLGLAIVAAVVEAHHGRVDVSSRPGRTAFTVRLPDSTADA